MITPGPKARARGDDPCAASACRGRGRKLWRYMVPLYLRINAVVCSVMAQLSGTPEHLALKEQIWGDHGPDRPQAQIACARICSPISCATPKVVPAAIKGYTRLSSASTERHRRQRAARRQRASTSCVRWTVSACR